MRILVDADACPVVDRVVKAARQHGLPCVLYCDTAHRMEKPGATTVIVGQGADSADFALVNAVAAGDIVVTQDYGLAAMCLARGALVLNQDGMQYTNDNIDALLAQRHTAAKVRRAGGRLRGNAPRTPQQDECFSTALEILINAAGATQEKEE